MSGVSPVNCLCPVRPSGPRAVIYSTSAHHTKPKSRSRFGTGLWSIIVYHRCFNKEISPSTLWFCKWRPFSNQCTMMRIFLTRAMNMVFAQEGAKTKFMALVKKMRIIVHWSEKGRHLQNHKVDGEISLLKQLWYNIMDRRQVPKRLWDFGLVWCAEVLSVTAWGADARTGHKQVTGETPDISDWLDFSFFNLVHYWKNDTMLDMTDNKKQFG